MAATELDALDTAVAEFTGGASHELFVLDAADDRERWQGILHSHLARVDPELAELDDSYLLDGWDEYDSELDVVVIVETDAYPRNAGMASGFYHAIKAIRLPSGASVYFQTSEYHENGIRAVASSNMDDQAAAVLGEVIALPTHFHAGGTLLEIDRHITVCTPDSWITEALLDVDADWMPQETIDKGVQHRDEMDQALGEAGEEGDADEDELRRASALVYDTPPWFLLLTDGDLEEIAAYEQRTPDHSPPLQNTFHPWIKPSAEMFLDPRDPANFQHIVAAYLKARDKG